MNAKSPIVTELRSFNYAILPPGFNLAAHLHHFFQLDVVLKGSVIIRLEGESRSVSSRAGDAVLIPPLLRHGYESRAGFQQGSFKLHLASWCWAMVGVRPVRFRVPALLRELIHATGRNRQDRETLATQRTLAVASLCAIEALSCARSTTPYSDSLDAFRRILWPLLEEVARNPTADWSVARMARACHLSVDHFSRRFRELLKQTPHQYLFESRMRLAASEVLADPPRAIKNVAAMGGYATVHAFTVAFKKAFGISPAAYRRSRPDL